MDSIFKSLHQKSIFFTGLLCLAIAGLALGLLLPDFTLFSIAERQEMFWTNVALINYTFLGSAEFAFLLIAFFFFRLKRNKEGSFLLTSTLVTLLIIQLIKNLSSSGNTQLYFESGQYLFNKAAELADNYYSISSHTAIAFSLATSLVLINGDKKMQLFFLLIALAVGCSRIYLANHSAIAMSIAALVGSLSSLTVYFVVMKEYRKTHFTAEEKALHERRVMYN